MTSREHAAMTADNFYKTRGDAYFAQREGARSERVQRIRATMFQELAGDGVTILDFGCGTGGILGCLAAARRIGVEPGDRAAAEARAKGVEVHPSLTEVPPESADLAISFHAIEHVERPLDALCGILRALKPGGRARLVVPCETPIRRIERSWRPNDEQHLYTWNPLLFGNLAARAGFEKIDARLAPMPSGSRAAQLLGSRSFLGRSWSTYVNLRDNSYNVVLDAFAPEVGCE